MTILTTFYILNQAPRRNNHNKFRIKSMFYSFEILQSLHLTVNFVERVPLGTA